MSNTNATLSASIIAMETLQFIRQRFPILTAVSTDFSADPVKWNQSIISRVVTPISAADYSTSTGYVASDVTTTDVTVTVNKHKHVSIAFNEQELSSTGRNLIQEQAEAAAYSLGLQMSNDLWALATTTNFSTNTALNVANDAAVVRTVLTSIRQKLVHAGATLNRQGILGSGAFMGLLNDSAITYALNTNANVDYMSGVIAGYAGYQRIVEFDGLPAGSTPFVKGFFGGKECLVIASRLPADPGAMVGGGLNIPGEIGVVSDPDTGLSLQYRYFYDMKLGKLQMTLTVMYGVAVGVQAHGILLTTTS